MVLATVLLGACADRGSATEEDSGTAGTASSGGMMVGEVTGQPGTSDSSADSTGSSPTTSPPGTETSLDGGSSSEATGAETTGPTPDCAPDCPTHPLDVLFVVDNSATMGPDQLKLGMALDGLMDQLQQLQVQQDLYLDLNVMVTTTDFGNPLCTPFEPPGYDPARGSPVSSSCTSRLDQFTGLGGSPVFTEACTEVCPVAVEPRGSFVHVVGPDDNVPGGSARQALQCLLPQGISGCGYESPLENTLQALDPSARWNQGAEPFLRPEADLAVVVLTDESDCSIDDDSMVGDASLQAIDPDTGLPAPSSAMCWNAGVTCDPPDGTGVYEGCQPAVGPLREVQRYTGYLVDELAITQGKDVMMLALVGVPPVLSHAPDAPFEPLMGGAEDLVVRDWIDGEYPMGDVVPEEWAAGIDAADKAFQLGVGPGCTGPDGVGATSQGQPPLRIQAVCEALDGQGGTHCCMESVCDEAYGPAMQCLRGMIETAL